jgi:hypothetical protein
MNRTHILDMSKKEIVTNLMIPLVESKANLSKIRSQGLHYDTKTYSGRIREKIVTSGARIPRIPQ